jgi:hypothetical protein
LYIIAQRGWLVKPLFSEGEWQNADYLKPVTKKRLRRYGLTVLTFIHLMLAFSNFAYIK